jgi:hypothetical protein
MNYRRIYDSIIERARTRDEIMQYFEVHHIYPKCMGGSNDESNLVNLTLEEHFVCHQLLVKIYPAIIGLQYALRMMCIGMPCRKRNKIYGWIKRLNYKPKRARNCKFCNSIFYARDSVKKELCSMICRDNYIKSKRINLICKFCNKQFTAAPSHINQSFCSEHCRLTSKHILRINKKCLVCEKDFSVVQFNKHQKCCSNLCSTQMRQKRTSHKCNNCSKEFMRLSAIKREKYYCSRECYAQDRQITKPCLCCNKEFTAQKHLNRKFCSRQCYLDKNL